MLKELKIEGKTIAYHGSPCRDIVTGKFKKGQHGYLGPGIYFSEDQYYAKRYAKKYGSGALYTAEIVLNNPLILTDENPTKDFLTVVYGTESVYARRERKQSNSCYLIEPKDIKKFLSMGYDGVIWDFAGNKEFVLYSNENISILDKEDILEESKKEETTFYRFYSEIRKFLENILKNPIKTKPSKYLEDRKFTKERLIKLLMNNNIIKRDEKILVPGKDDVKHVQYSIKYTLKPESFNDKIEKIYKKYFGEEDGNVLNEEMDMFSCANIVGVVSGKGKGVGSEMCDRWANYVNKKKDKPRSVFADEDEMKKAILKDKQDREAYLTRGGIKF